VTGRRERLAGQIKTFIQQYGSQHGPPKQEPNDRKYDRNIAKLVRRMDPQELDDLLREDDLSDEPHDAPPGKRTGELGEDR
jgi:hypothetical protein